ncbi:hypothetical protein U1Q18_038011 [Sarracenia purpurea var. burkii]
MKAQASSLTELALGKPVKVVLSCWKDARLLLLVKFVTVCRLELDGVYNKRIEKGRGYVFRENAYETNVRMAAIMVRRLTEKEMEERKGDEEEEEPVENSSKTREVEENIHMSQFV